MCVNASTMQAYTVVQNVRDRVQFSVNHLKKEKNHFTLVHLWIWNEGRRKLQFQIYRKI